MPNQINIAPLSGALGAEIDGINLAEPLTPMMVKRIRKAFLDNQVLVFPNQQLTPKQQLAFARRFGTTDIYPFLKSIDGVPQVIEILKTEKDTSNFGKHWHSDTTYMPKPNMGTMLYALEVPNPGGDTLFADMTRAYDKLSNNMKTGIDNLFAVHDWVRSREKSNERPATPDEIKAAPPVIHPIVRTHPETGKKSLYIGNHSSHIVDMALEEGEAILANLETHATQQDLIYRHKWQIDDVLMWDNRCTMHCVEPYDAAKEKRSVHRVVVRGDAPV